MSCVNTDLRDKQKHQQQQKKGVGAPGLHNGTDRHCSGLGLPGCVSHKRLVGVGVVVGEGGPIKLKLNKRVRWKRGKKGGGGIAVCLPVCVSVGLLTVFCYQWKCRVVKAGDRSGFSHCRAVPWLPGFCLYPSSSSLAHCKRASSILSLFRPDMIQPPHHRELGVKKPSTHLFFQLFYIQNRLFYRLPLIIMLFSIWGH